MAPPGIWNIVMRVYFLYEDAIVRQILRSPTFHHGVRHVHRRVEEMRHGRDPNDPLRPGEATEEPKESSNGFLKHFVDELRNQFRGNSTEPPPPSPPSPPKR